MDCLRKKEVSEKKCLVAVLALLVVAVIIITVIMVFTAPSYCETSSCLQTSRHLLRLIDFTRKPCENFYNFVCGNFMIVSHESKIVSIIENEQSKSWYKLKAMILEQIGVNDTKSLRLQKQFYQFCSNLTAIDADNDTTFLRLITHLGGWPVVIGNEWNETAFDFVESMVALRKVGLQHDWFLNISVYKVLDADVILKINVPDNANKIENEMKQKYVDLMSEIAIAFGAHDHVAKTQMEEVITLENKLADLIEEVNTENKGSQESSFKLISIYQLQHFWQKINWLEFLNQITNRKLLESQQVAFFVNDYLPKLDNILKITTKRTQANYIVWKLIELYAPLLSRKVRKPVAEYQKRSTNQYKEWYKSRNTYCFEESRSLFQYAIEAAYLRRYVSRQKRQKIEKMVERIQAQLESHLMNATWMDDQTKKTALLKLQNISFIIGGPEEMYYAEQFDRYIGVYNIEFNASNIIELMTHILANSLDLLYEVNENAHMHHLKHEFYELVPSMETRFLRDYNILYIPAGVLHELFYDDDRPEYLNYGTIGTIIGHELTHGFDTGTFGNRTWWSNSTFDNFEVAITRLLNCTNGLDQNHLEMNCKSTLIENMADYTGINLAHEAYQQWVKENGPEKVVLPGLGFTNNQLFWLAYGSLMCHVPVAELNSGRCKHTSMLPSYRIIGSFRNSPYFGEDFSCDLGSNMNPRDKCQIL